MSHESPLAEKRSELSSRVIFLASAHDERAVSPLHKLPSDTRFPTFIDQRDELKVPRPAITTCTLKVFVE
jgi:hypothetical protein